MSARDGADAAPARTPSRPSSFGDPSGADAAPLSARLVRLVGPEVLGLAAFLLLVVGVFSLATERFLTAANFGSVAVQLPELGLLTLAMLLPILSGGLNLAVTFTANIAALVLAWVLQAGGGAEAGAHWFVAGVALALFVGAAAGFVTGAVIALSGAHPILVSLSMMIFLRGLGEFLTRGGDISGFPGYVATLGQGSVAGVPIPLVIFLLAVGLWHVLLGRTRLGFFTYMIGSNVEATRYSGVNTRRSITWIYTLSGAMCALAGIVMLARFNSVRVGHGEAYLLITVLACFLGGVDPFGGFGRVGSVLLALVILQLLSSGLNLVGANQHLGTAVWGLILIAVMVLRFVWHRLADWHTRRRLRRERVRAAGEANPSREPEIDE